MLQARVASAAVFRTSSSYVYPSHLRSGATYLHFHLSANRFLALFAESQPSRSVHGFPASTPQADAAKELRARLLRGIGPGFSTAPKKDKVKTSSNLRKTESHALSPSRTTAKKPSIPGGAAKKRKRAPPTAEPTFSVAIVGRPNVGKSTLFNRLVRKRLAIVHNTPGVTRDRKEAVARLSDLVFKIVDTAGLDDCDFSHPSVRNPTQRAMNAQTAAAVTSADVVLFLVDGREGLSPGDHDIARWVRKLDRPVILLANKCEFGAGLDDLGQFDELGFGEPLPVSAEHAEGMAELYTALLPYAEVEAAAQNGGHEAVPPEEATGVDAERTAEGCQQGQATEAANTKTAPTVLQSALVVADESVSAAAASADGAEEARDFRNEAISLAVVGQPNVGKSSIINRILGEERVITSPIAGTTRDAIRVEWRHAGRSIHLIDTAGLRRKITLDDKLDALSQQDAEKAIDFAHVVALVLDIQAEISNYELNIARRVLEEGRSLMIVANKKDLAESYRVHMANIWSRLQDSLAQAKKLPLLPVSARTGSGVSGILPRVISLYDRWNLRVPTASLNRWLARMVAIHEPPFVEGSGHNVRLKLRYMTQVSTRPPTFAVFFAKAKEVPEQYCRYLINGLRDEFELHGVPIRLHQRRLESKFRPSPHK